MFGRRKDYQAAGLTYTVQFSVDLNNGLDSTAIPDVLASDEEIDAVSVKYPRMGFGGRASRWTNTRVTLIPLDKCPRAVSRKYRSNDSMPQWKPVLSCCSDSSSRSNADMSGKFFGRLFRGGVDCGWLGEKTLDLRGFLNAQSPVGFIFNHPCRFAGHRFKDERRHRLAANRRCLPESLCRRCGEPGVDSHHALADWSLGCRFHRMSPCAENTTCGADIS